MKLTNDLLNPRKGVAMPQLNENHELSSHMCYAERQVQHWRDHDMFNKAYNGELTPVDKKELQESAWALQGIADNIKDILTRI